MIDSTALEIILSLITAMLGMVAIGAGMIGYWYRHVKWYERIIAIVTGLLLIYPEGYSDTIGFVMFVIMFVIQYMSREKTDRNSRVQAS